MKSIFLEQRTDSSLAFILRLILTLILANFCHIPDSNFRQNFGVLKGKNTGQRKHHLIKKREREEENALRGVLSLDRLSVLQKAK